MPRLLRADAQGNRDRVLEAARELFADRGITVTMRDVARHAEVGPATLYRRFPTKPDLLEAVFAREVENCQGIVERACADPDAWRGFRLIVEQLLVHNSRNQGFTEAFTSADPRVGALTRHRQGLLRRIGALARRAQEAGELRADFVVGDLVLVLQAGRGLAAVPAAKRPAAARRLATLAVDGFRATR